MGEDYTIAPASITLAANQTSGSATITVVDDGQVEEDETITLAASHDGAPIETVGIIISASDQTNFNLLVADPLILEGESTTVTVETGGVTFASAQTISLTLSGSATAVDDYTIAPASITIAAGAISGSATITTSDDAFVEGDETITISGAA